MKTLDLQIREFTADDYADYWSIDRAVYPDYELTVEQIRHEDESHEAHIVWRRWLAYLAGQVVGAAGFSQRAMYYHPRKLWLDLLVHPGWRGRGIGGRLFEHLLSEIAALDSVSLTTVICESDEPSLRFARRHGCEIVMREQESRLDITAFNPAAFTEALAVEEKLGLRILSLSELMEERDDWEVSYHELDQEILADVPSPEPFVAESFAAWRKRRLENPSFRPELTMMAIADGQLIGASYLRHGAIAGRTETGLTGVRRDWRGKGIAMAMKVAALARARELGYKTTLTWNEVNNRSMLGINKRLGFKEHPAWLEMRKTLDEK